MEASVSLGYYVNLIRDDGKEFAFALSLKGIHSILKFLILCKITKALSCQNLK